MSTINANTTVNLDGSTSFKLGTDTYKWDNRFIFVVDAYVPDTNPLLTVTFNLKGTNWNAEFLNFSGNNKTVITDATTGAGAVYIDFIGLFGTGPNTVTLKNAEVGVIRGGSSSDTVSVGYYANSIILGRGNDKFSLTGAGEVSFVDMGRGNDTVNIGGGYIMAVDMGRGNDTVTVGAGSYGIIAFGRDADTIKFAANASYGEIVNGGEGISDDLAGAKDFDTLDFSAFTRALTVDLAGGQASAEGFGTQIRGFEKVIGGTGADKIIGTDDADTFDGRGGNDILTGGKGKDIFIFAAKLGSTNIDTIDDYSVTDDTMLLDDDVFSAVGAVGDLAAGAFFIGTKAHDTSDRIIYDKTSGKLWYDADGTGATVAVQFAKLDPGLSLTAADFDIIA